VQGEEVASLRAALEVLCDEKGQVSQQAQIALQEQMHDLDYR
jgi:hypothetical protein